MTGKQLRDICRDNPAVPIIFNKKIEGLRGRFENGMMAYVVGVSESSSDFCIVKIEEGDFAEYNKSIEKKVWYNILTGNYDLRYSESPSSNGWHGFDYIIEWDSSIIDFLIVEEHLERIFR